MVANRLGVTASSMSTPGSVSQEFPCSITLRIPFPTSRLATIALRVLSVDKELSPLVQRALSLNAPSLEAPEHKPDITRPTSLAEDSQTLIAHYQATTNRMLRVSVNGFMDNLALVLDMMATLDMDVIQQQHGSDSQAVPVRTPDGG